jgi:non-heme chloroperoxidase
MKKTVLFGALLFAAFVAQGAQARTLAGTWLGSLNGQRIILNIFGSGKSLSALVTNLDQAADQTVGDPVSGITLQNATLKFSFGGSVYQGQVWNNSITGTWTQGKPMALDFHPVAASVMDPYAHKVSFITVAKNVKLEVLDYGGNGRPLIFLAGLGSTAHVFDRLAPKFTAGHHVYAITRRGFGHSSQPDPAMGDYSADRLGDDVLAVMDGLKLDRPVIAGHSMAGSELSDIASRHPEKVSGLIYLDAGYPYAYYVPGNVIAAGGIVGENLVLDAKDLRKELEHLKTLPWQDQDLAPIIARLQILIPQFEKDLAATQTALETDPVFPAPADSRAIEINLAVLAGTQKFGPIGLPALALFADPLPLPASTPPETRAAQNAQVEAQVASFAAANPSVRVVRLANARHALWMSNEADVIREVNAFMDGLKS